MCLVLMLLLAVQDDADVVKALSDESVEVRKEAVAALIQRGRASVPQIRRILGNAPEQAKLEAEKALDEISLREVRRALDDAKIPRPEEPIGIADDAVARRLPATRIYLQRTEADTGSGKRVVVVNDLAGEKGAPRLLRSSADVVPLFAEAAKDRDGAVAIARAALFLVRTMHSSAHSDELVPGGGRGHDGKGVDWTLPDEYPMEKKDGAWCLENVSMKFGHDFHLISVSFDPSGRLTEIKAVYTGVSCK